MLPARRRPSRRSAACPEPARRAGRIGHPTMAACTCWRRFPNLTDGNQVMHELFVEDVLVDGLVSIEGGRSAVPERAGSRSRDRLGPRRPLRAPVRRRRSVPDVNVPSVPAWLCSAPARRARTPTASAARTCSTLADSGSCRLRPRRNQKLARPGTCATASSGCSSPITTSTTTPTTRRSRSAGGTRAPTSSRTCACTARGRRARSLDRLFGAEGAFAFDIAARMNNPPSHIAHQERGGTLPRLPPGFDLTVLEPGAQVAGTGGRSERPASSTHSRTWTRSRTGSRPALARSCCRATRVLPGAHRPGVGADTLVMMCWDEQPRIVRSGLDRSLTGTMSAGEVAAAAGVRRLVLTHINRAGAQSAGASLEQAGEALRRRDPGRRRAARIPI